MSSEMSIERRISSAGCVITSGKRLRDGEYFDLNEAVSEVLAMARSAIAKNGIAASTQFADGLVPVQGDRVQLQQVVMNLILNAVEQ